jgi:predicted  nucleic acid-binding Zn-ribbon protein
MSSQLQKVKERLSKYKEDIDVAEERELKAKSDRIDVEARCETTSNEVDGLKRRLVLIQKDLDKVNDRLDSAQSKLNHAEGRFGDDDGVRQEFEVTEMERDEQLAVLDEVIRVRKYGIVFLHQ